MQDKVASGLYQTASEVIQEGLRLLKERDERQQATLREAIQEWPDPTSTCTYQDHISLASRRTWRRPSSNADGSAPPRGADLPKRVCHAIVFPRLPPQI